MRINGNEQTNKYISFSSNPNQVKYFINKERMSDHFIRIAKIDTGSNPDYAGQKSPTTYGQIVLAKELAQDLKQIGLQNIEVDNFGILTATLPANVQNAPTIGFIAHMDTDSGVNTSNVNPLVHDYEDGNIELKDNQVIPQEDLLPYKGHKIITSDGTSLLGADDKAGISEIIEALKVFSEHPELKRPTIKVAFTPDEEGAGGIDNFDVKKFNADVAYTVDGSEPEFIDTETFNAINVTIILKGVPAHCGDAYKRMINSIDLAREFMEMIPKDEKPEATKDRDGFYHITSIEGNENETKLKILVRDFDYEVAQNREQFLNDCLEKLKEKYPQINYEMQAKVAYQNIKRFTADNSKIIDYAKLGIKKTGLIPKEQAIRGGTDGCELSAKGLPCPNLGAGGMNFHTQREFVSVDTMAQCCENLINIAQIWAMDSK